MVSVRAWAMPSGTGVTDEAECGVWGQCYLWGFWAVCGGWAAGAG